MALNYHIERIYDTQANGLANLDPEQIMILSDQDHELCWTDNSTPNRFYMGAKQKYYNGSAWTYCDNDMNSVWLPNNGSLLLGNSRASSFAYLKSNGTNIVLHSDNSAAIYVESAGLVQVDTTGNFTVRIPTGSTMDFQINNLARLTLASSITIKPLLDNDIILNATSAGRVDFAGQSVTTGSVSAYGWFPAKVGGAAVDILCRIS